MNGRLDEVVLKAMIVLVAILIIMLMVGSFRFDPAAFAYQLEAMAR